MSLTRTITKKGVCPACGKRAGRTFHIYSGEGSYAEQRADIEAQEAALKDQLIYHSKCDEAIIERDRFRDRYHRAGVINPLLELSKSKMTAAGIEGDEYLFWQRFNMTLADYRESGAL